MKNTETISHALLTLALATALLTGCGSAEPAPAAAPADSGAGGQSDASYADALDVSGQLALGTLRLEETENAVTAEQAALLLPLWQALRSGTLQSEEETDAVLKQIQGAMTPGQITAIQAMQLTEDGVRSWAESQGPDFRERQGPASGGGQTLNLEDLPPEMQERLKQQFGSQLPSPEQLEELRGQFRNMSDEERQAMRATAEASGQTSGRPASGMGQWAMLLNPLIELLGERAAT
jgi:hypothetical protein